MSDINLYGDAGGSGANDDVVDLYGDLSAPAVSSAGISNPMMSSSSSMGHHAGGSGSGSNSMMSAPSGSSSTATSNASYYPPPPSQSRSASSMMQPSGDATSQSAVYVHGFAWWTTDATLAELGERVSGSRVVDVTFYEDRANGKSKGLALIEFADPEAANNAIQALHGTVIDKRMVTAEEADRDETGVFSLEAQQAHNIRQRLDAQITQQSGSYGPMTGQRDQRGFDRGRGGYNRESRGGYERGGYDRGGYERGGRGGGFRGGRDFPYERRQRY
jgi:cleavage and polyadenylation specificity factor subunit 6/7